MMMTRNTEQQNAIDIARMDERLSNIERDISEINKTILDMQKDMRDINSASARVKGGIFVVLLIGGVIGWLTTLGSTLVRIWPFH
jgi:hypothetical protein